MSCQNSKADKVISKANIVISDDEGLEVCRKRHDEEIEVEEISKLKNDDGISNKLMEFMGLPKSYRSSLYNEFVQDVQVFTTIPSDTASSFMGLVNWICGKSDAETVPSKKEEEPQPETKRGDGDDESRPETPAIDHTPKGQEVNETSKIETPFSEVMPDQVNNNPPALGETQGSAPDPNKSAPDFPGKVCTSDTSLYGYCLEEDSAEEDILSKIHSESILDCSKGPCKRVTFATPPSETNIYAYAHDESESEEEAPKVEAVKEIKEDTLTAKLEALLPLPALIEEKEDEITDGDDEKSQSEGSSTDDEDSHPPDQTPVKPEEKKETHIWKEATGALLTSSICDINLEPCLIANGGIIPKSSSSSSGPPPNTPLSVDALNANVSLEEDLDRATQIRKSTEKMEPSLLRETPKGTNLSDQGISSESGSKAAVKPSLSNNNMPVSNVSRPNSAAKEGKKGAADNKIEPFSCTGDQKQYKEDLKTLEEIVKKLYKNMDKKGPVTIVANFKPKSDGELQLEIGTKSKPGTPVAEQNSNSDISATRKRSACDLKEVEKTETRNVGTQEEMPVVTQTSAKASSNHGITSIMKTTTSSPSHNSSAGVGRKASVSFAPETILAEPMEKASKCFACTYNAYSKQILQQQQELVMVDSFQVTEEISLPVRTSSTQLPERSSSNANIQTDPNYYPGSDYLNEEGSADQFHQSTTSIQHQSPPVYISRHDSGSQADLPAVRTNPSFQALPCKLNPSGPLNTGRTFSGQMRIIQPCRKHSLHSKQPSSTILQPSTTSLDRTESFTRRNSFSVTTPNSGCPLHGGNVNVSINNTPIRGVSSTNVSSNNSSASTLGSSVGAGEGQSKKRSKVYIPQPPPSQRHNSYREIFRHKQQQQQTFYVDLTSKGLKRERSGLAGQQQGQQQQQYRHSLH